MKARDFRLLILFPFVLAAQNGPGGDYSFQPPAGYQVRDINGALDITRVDQQRKFFCQFGLYPSQPSQGSAQQDMDTEWRAVVANQFKLQGMPATRDLSLPQAPGSLLRTSEAIDRNGKSLLANLLVLRFPNQRYIGLLYNTSSAATSSNCEEDLVKLVSSIQMKSAAASPSGPATITGVWERVNSGQPAGRFNIFTKQWEYDAAAAALQFRQVRRFRFEASGQYTFELDAEDYNRSERSRVVERGRYTVKDGMIHFQPESIAEGKGPRNSNPALSARQTPAPHARRFLLGEHPQFQNSAGLQLQDGNGWETYKPVK